MNQGNETHTAGVVIFVFSFALSALVNKATEREPLEF